MTQSDDASVPTRVAIVRARYTGAGGAERFVQRALDALGREGLQLSILARSWDAAQQSGQGLQWVPIDPFYIGSRWRDASFAKAVRRHIEVTPYDLVQSHERIEGVGLYRAGDGVHAAFLKRRAAFQSPVQRLGVRLNRHHQWVLAQERAMFTSPALQAVICNSNMVMNEIHEHFGVPRSKLHLIRNGLDLDRFCLPTDEQRLAARQSFGLLPKQKVVCFVGSGFERKGLRQAIIACAAQGADAPVLLVAGKDKAQKKYEQLAEAIGYRAKLRFLGALDRVQPVLWSSDLMLLPAIYDPFPNAAIEALACGVPLLTSDACGVGELLEGPSMAGQVVPANDQAVINAHCARLLSVADRSGQMHQCRQVVADLSLASMASQLVNLYQHLLRARAKA